MKNIFGIILVSLATAVMFGSCIKEVFPEDGTVTIDQIENTSTDIRVRGLHGWMNKFDVMALGDDAVHYDFGYPSLMIQREMMGQDLLIPRPIYGWWNSWRRLTGLGPEYTRAHMPWRWYYRMVEMTNGIIGTFSGVQDVPESEQVALGMAYTYRAMAYFDLVRLYLQGRYVDNQNGLSVPIITEATTLDQTKDNPRANAEDVYTLIFDDLEKAELYLRDHHDSGNLPDYSVVMGVYARVYLERENWPLAEQYAAAAQSGFTPMTESEWTNRATGFNTPTNAWMWWATVTSNDDVAKTGIITWPAHMSNEARYGYAGYGEYIAINSHLFSLIPETDFRRNSFKSEGVVDSDSPYRGNWPNYASVKFRPGSGDFFNYTVGNSVSVPLMRVEEMILIEAEAAGRQTVASGVTKLNEFVQTYRDPDYLCTATTTDEFVEDVWLQRRIELWGEGFSAFDLKRLNKPVIRSFDGTNYAVGERFNTDEAPSWLDLVIPRNEITSNEGIPQEQNNPTPSNPGDSPEHVW